jgi:uncharacterized membrane protein YbhN (UPF0104 family)
MILATAGALLLVIADMVVRALRLRALLGPVEPRRLASAVAVNALGDAASALTPARFGGEPARFLALRNRGAPTSASAVVLAAERVVDMGLAAVVAVVAAALLGARGFDDVSALAARFASPSVLPWMILVAVVVIAFAIAAVQFRHRFPRVGPSLRDAVSHARAMVGARLGAAVGLSIVSMASRVAVLPVLLWGSGALRDPVAVAVGSFALIYAQLLLPTPAGVGGVELGFVVGVAPLLPPAEVAGLLLAWRCITLGVPAGLGAVLFGYSRLTGPRRSRDPGSADSRARPEPRGRGTA